VWLGRDSPTKQLIAKEKRKKENLYLVYVDAIPTSQSKEYGKIENARFDVFLKASSKKEAEMEAARVLMTQLWLVTYWRFALRITPVRFRKVDKATQGYCLLVEKLGIPFSVEKGSK
jgi:hypothetical protein